MPKRPPTFDPPAAGSPRPSLAVDHAALGAVSAKLAASGHEREQFVADPRAYLRERLGSDHPCGPLRGRAAAATSELVACFAMVAFNCIVTSYMDFAVAVRVGGIENRTQGPGPGFGDPVVV